MSRPHSRPARPCRLALLSCGLSGALALPLVATLPPLAASAAPDGSYPPASLFRNLQLTALACGRDNDAPSCDKARALADPLLDQPRLSASCKDTLWSIREKAFAAPRNSLERRDAIDRAAKDVTVFCRQPAVPGSSGPAAGGQGAGGAGASGSAPSVRP